MIAVVDYKAGNLTSVARALYSLGVPCEVTGDPERILSADRVIFPGVGAAGRAMAHLNSSGLGEVIREVFERGTPLLGICLGAQIVLEYSEENDTSCLGLIKGRTRAFADEFRKQGITGLKIPHMGWNQVQQVRPHPLFEEVPTQADFYFVHSYFPDPSVSSCRVGVTEYGVPFTSALAWKNLAAVQFHPEKSGAVGLRILERFSAWDGSDNGSSIL